MQHRWCVYACLLLLALYSSLSQANHAPRFTVLKGVEVDVTPLQSHSSNPRQLLQADGPACGQQFSVNASSIQSGYYYFGCFREFLSTVPCVTFGTRIRNAPGLILTEGWMTITNLNAWKGSKNQISDWATLVEPGSMTNCTADILGKCDMAGRFPTPADDTYYCNVVYAQGEEGSEATRVTRVKLGGLDSCEDC